VILYGTVLIAVLVVDQLTKGWIVNTFGLYESREVVAGLFNLVYVTNKGAAFSLFATIDSPLRHYFFVTVNLIALSVLTIAAFKMRAERWYLLSFGLISGGALGNLVDRLRYGAVVDFLDFILVHIIGRPSMWPIPLYFVGWACCWCLLSKNLRQQLKRDENSTAFPRTGVAICRYGHRVCFPPWRL
jgi:signal peptidase II